MNFTSRPVLDLDMLSESLKYFRKLNKFTKKDVAYCLGICPTEYLKYESGEAYITLPMLDILSRLYKATTDDIIYSQILDPNPNLRFDF